MAAKPRLPTGYDLPTAVNGWRHDPNDGSNGHTWSLDAGERPLSVRVFEHFGRCYARVTDDRTTGIESSEEIAARSHDEDGDQTTQATVAAVVAEAVEWMREHDVGEWSHPRIREAVFDPPLGYELVAYEIGQRWSLIHYHRIDAPEKSRLAGVGLPDEVNPETYPYLVIRTWAGSGNSEIDLAPWRFSHDDERESVADPPAECGLDVAVTVARTVAREQHDSDAPEPSSHTGQTALQQFAGGG
jgi:hypothetical protein